MAINAGSTIRGTMATASTTAGLVGLGGRELAKSLEAVGLGGAVSGHVRALGSDGAVASGGQALLDTDTAVVDEGGDDVTARITSIIAGFYGAEEEDKCSTSARAKAALECLSVLEYSIHSQREAALPH